MPGTGYQHMVHDYYVKRLRATYTERRATLRALRERAQARQYQEEFVALSRAPSHLARERRRSMLAAAVRLNDTFFE